MTGRKQTTPAISRSYEPASDACARAIEFLLRKPLVRERGGPETAPEDAERRSNEIRAEDILP